MSAFVGEADIMGCAPMLLLNPSGRRATVVTAKETISAAVSFEEV